MRTNKIIIALAIVFIVSVALIAGCKKNESGNPIEIPVQTALLETVPLVSAANFAVLAGTAINSKGTTIVTGDLGLSPGTSVNGFPEGKLVGAQQVNNVLANQAKFDLTSAYNDAEGRTSTDVVMLAGDVGGLTLTPGLYKSTSSLEIASGDLTFDARGNPQAIFIIQVATTLSTSMGRNVILKGGALASNIFWQVGNSATFGTDSDFKGTVLAMQSITFGTGASLDGRGLARNGEVTMSGNTIAKQ